MNLAGKSKCFIAAVALAGLAGVAHAWDTPTDISGPGAFTNSLRLAIDGKGRTVAVWNEIDGFASTRVVAALRQPKTPGFGGPAQISLSGADSFGATVAVSKKGHIAVGWHRNEFSPNPVAQVAIAAPGSAVFTAPQTASPAAHYVSGPRVAMDKKGNTTVVWENQAESYRPYAATWPAGGSFGAPQALSPDDATGLRILEGPKGKATAFWHRYDGMDFLIEASVRPKGGSFGPPQVVNDPMTPGFFPTGAFDNKGNALIGWAGRTATMGAKDTTFGIPVAGPTGQSANFQFDKKGNLSVFWISNPGYAATYQYRPVGEEFLVSTEISSGAISGSPSMAIDKKGNVRAVWTEYDGMVSRVWTALRPAGGTFGPAEALSPEGIDTSDTLVVFDKKGNATVSWLQEDDLGYYHVMITNQPI